MFLERLERMQKASIKFNKEVFGSISHRKWRVEQRLKGVQRDLKRMDLEALKRLEKELHREYEDILPQEEILWYQKSREKWVRFGDLNSKFFHTRTVVRRKKNKIHGLFVGNGDWCTHQETLQEEAVSFFTNLFSLDVQVSRNYIMENATPTISGESKMELLLPVSFDEVRRVVMAMHPFKALGSDGFEAFFYKQYWPIVGRDLYQLVSTAFHDGHADPTLLETLLVLIPKVDNPVRLKEFRPISLCNVAYKVITKVLVNRFRPLLDTLVGPLQGSFIPGRGTKDNIL
jgi:hypothetical protein